MPAMLSIDGGGDRDAVQAGQVEGHQDGDTQNTTSQAVERMDTPRPAMMLVP